MMTGVVNKFQRILGSKVHERYTSHRYSCRRKNASVVFVSHMEHHLPTKPSRLETLLDVEVIEPNDQGLVDWGI